MKTSLAGALLPRPCASAAPSHPAMRATLATLGELEAQGAPHFARAAATLRAILAGVRTSAWPEVAWSFSRLQPGGCPLELTFSTASEAVWAVAEVAGPEMPEAQRLARAAFLLEGLGQPPAAARLEELAQLQAGGPLRWGTWLGARHAPEGDRYKLYAEAPSGGAGAGGAAAADLVRRVAGDPRGGLLLGGRAELNSVGAEATGRIELYFRVQGMVPGDLDRLLASAGQEARNGELRDLLDRLWEIPAERALALAVWGFSLSFSPAGHPDAFSFFKRASQVLGGDRRLRRRLLALGAPGQLDAYTHLTCDIPGRPADAPHCHRLLAVIAVAGRALELRIGIDPSLIPNPTPKGDFRWNPSRPAPAPEPKPPIASPFPTTARA